MARLDDRLRSIETGQAAILKQLEIIAPNGVTPCLLHGYRLKRIEKWSKALVIAFITVFLGLVGKECVEYVKSNRSHPERTTRDGSANTHVTTAKLGIPYSGPEVGD